MEYDEFLDLYDRTFGNVQRCGNKYAGRAILHLMLGQMIRHIKIARDPNRTIYGYIDPRMHVMRHFKPGSGQSFIGDFISKILDRHSFNIITLDSGSYSYSGIIGALSGSDIILYRDCNIKNSFDSYVGGKIADIFDGCMGYEDADCHVKGKVVRVKPDMSFFFDVSNTLDDTYKMKFARNMIIMNDRYEFVPAGRIDIKNQPKKIMHLVVSRIFQI
jgi:hypothetical protein